MHHLIAAITIETYRDWPRYAALMRDFTMAKQTYEENHKKQEFTDTAKSIEEHKAGE